MIWIIAGATFILGLTIGLALGALIVLATKHVS